MVFKYEWDMVDAFQSTLPSRGATARTDNKTIRSYIQTSINNERLQVSLGMFFYLKIHY